MSTGGDLRVAPGFVYRLYIRSLGGIRGNKGQEWPGTRDRVHLV